MKSPIQWMFCSSRFATARAHLMMMTTALAVLSSCSTASNFTAAGHPVGMELPAASGGVQDDFIKARTLVEKGDFDQALEALLALRKSQGSKPEIELLTAEALRAQGHCLKAVHHLSLTRGASGAVGDSSKKLAEDWLAELVSRGRSCPSTHRAAAAGRLAVFLKSLPGAVQAVAFQELLTARMRSLAASGRCRDVLALSDDLRSVTEEPLGTAMLAMECQIRLGDEAGLKGRLNALKDPQRATLIRDMAQRAEEGFHQDVAAGLLELLKQVKADDPGVDLDLGRVYLKQGNNEKASHALNSYLDSAEAGEPRAIRAVQASELMAAFSQKELALSYLDSAMATADSFAIRMMRAELQWNMGRRSDAAETLLTYLKSNPREQLVDQTLATLLKWRGWPEGISLVNGLRSGGVDSSLNQTLDLYLGVFTTLDSGQSAGNQLLSSLLKSSPERASLALRVGDMLVAAGDRAQARLYFQQAVDLTSAGDEAVLKLAGVLWQEGDEAQARKLLTSWTDQQQDKVLALASLALWWTDQSRYKEALLSSTKAMKSAAEPGTDLKYLHGRLLLLNGREKDLARTLLEESVGFIPISQVPEAWQLAETMEGPAAACVKAGLLGREDLSPMVNETGRRGISPADRAFFIPLLQTDEFKILLTCGKGDVADKLMKFVDEASHPEERIRRGTSVLAAVISGGYLDAAATLACRVPEIPPLGASEEIPLLGRILGNKENSCAQARLTRLLATNALSYSDRITAAETFLARNFPAGVVQVLGDEWPAQVNEGGCRDAVLVLDAQLKLKDDDAAGATMNQQLDLCPSSDPAVSQALELLAARGPADKAFELGLDLLGRCAGGEGSKSYIAATLTAGIRSGKTPAEVGNRLSAVTATWNGEVAVARLLIATGAMTEAGSLLVAAVGKNPASLEALSDLLKLNKVRVLSGQAPLLSTDAVWDVITRHVLANGKSPEAVSKLVGKLETLGYIAEGYRAASSWLSPDSSSPAERLVMASIFVAYGQIKPALEQFRSAAFISSGEERSYPRAIRVLTSANLFQEQIELLEALLPRFPDDGRLKLALARVLFIQNTNDWERIEDLISQSLKDPATEITPAIELLLDGGRVKKAESLLLSVLGSAGPSKDDSRILAAFWHLIRLYSAQGNRDKLEELARSLWSESTINRSNLLENLLEWGYRDLARDILKSWKPAGGPASTEEMSITLQALRAFDETETNPTAQAAAAGLNSFMNDTIFSKKPDSPSEGMPPHGWQLFHLIFTQVEEGGRHKLAGNILKRAREFYPNDVNVLILAMERILTSAEASKHGDQVFKLLKAALKSKNAPAPEFQPVRFFHMLRAAGLDARVTRLLETSLRESGPGWWTGILLEALASAGDADKVSKLVQLLVEDEQSRTLLPDYADLLYERGMLKDAETLLLASLTSAQRIGDQPEEQQDYYSNDPASIKDAPDQGDETASKAALLLIQVASELEKLGAPGGSYLDLAVRTILSQPGDPAAQRAAAAEILESAAQWDRALEQLHLLQAIVPEQRSAYLGEFRILLKLGELDLARKAMWRQLAISDMPVTDLRSFASEAKRRLEFDLAAEILSAARTLVPQDRSLALETAGVLFMAGRDDEGLASLKIYLGSAQAPLRIRMEAAQVAFRTSRFKIAREILGEGGTWMSLPFQGRAELAASSSGETLSTFNRAIDGSPNPMLTARAILTALIGIPRVSSELIAPLLARAQDRSPSPGVNRYWEGYLLLKLGKEEAALPTFISALIGNPSRPAVISQVTEDLLSRGRTDLAQHFLEQVYNTPGNDPRIMNDLSRQVLRSFILGRIPQAVQNVVADFGVKVTQRALLADPANTWLLTQEAEILFSAGRVAEAKAVYDECMKFLPGVGGLHNNLAYLLVLSGGDLEQARILVEKALLREPANEMFYMDTLGWILFKQGKLEQAEALVRGALRRSDLQSGEALAESLVHLGMILEARGDLAGARKTFDLANVLDLWGPQGDKAREWLKNNGVDPWHR